MSKKKPKAVTKERKTISSQKVYTVPCASANGQKQTIIINNEFCCNCCSSCSSYTGDDCSTAQVCVGQTKSRQPNGNDSVPKVNNTKEKKKKQPTGRNQNYLQLTTNSTQQFFANSTDDKDQWSKRDDASETLLIIADNVANDDTINCVKSPFVDEIINESTTKTAVAWDETCLQQKFLHHTPVLSSKRFNSFNAFSDKKIGINNDKSRTKPIKNKISDQHFKMEQIVESNLDKNNNLLDVKVPRNIVIDIQQDIKCSTEEIGKNYDVSQMMISEGIYYPDADHTSSDLKIIDTFHKVPYKGNQLDEAEEEPTIIEKPNLTIRSIMFSENENELEVVNKKLETNLKFNSSDNLNELDSIVPLDGRIVSDNMVDISSQCLPRQIYKAQKMDTSNQSCLAHKTDNPCHLEKNNSLLSEMQEIRCELNRILVSYSDPTDDKKCENVPTSTSNCENKAEKGYYNEQYFEETDNSNLDPHKRCANLKSISTQIDPSFIAINNNANSSSHHVTKLRNFHSLSICALEVMDVTARLPLVYNENKISHVEFFNRIPNNQIDGAARLNFTEPRKSRKCFLRQKMFTSLESCVDIPPELGVLQPGIVNVFLILLLK